MLYISTAGQIAATWSALPPFDSLEFSTSQQGAAHSSDFVEHFVELSPSYVAATGATRAAFDVDVPGFDPAWRIDTTRVWGHNVFTTRTDGDSFLVFLGSKTSRRSGVARECRQPHRTAARGLAGDQVVCRYLFGEQWRSRWSAPGFDPSWRIDFTLPWDHEAEVLRTVGDDFLDSSRFEEIVP